MPRGWLSSRGRVLSRAGVGLLTWVIDGDVVDEAVGGAREKRLRLLPARAGVYFVLACCLLMARPYPEVIRQVTAGLEDALAAEGWVVPATTALTRLRVRVGERPLERVFRRLCMPLSFGAAPWSHFAGLLVVAWDGTMIDVAGSPANAAAFGRPPAPRRRNGATAAGGNPQVRLVTLIACGTRCLLDAAFGPMRGKGTGERALASRLTAGLGPGMLLLADRNFWSYALYRQVRTTRTQVLWRVRGNLHLPVVQALPDGSWISRVADPRARAARTARNGQRRRRGSSLPPDDSPLPAVTVRVISFTVTVAGEDGTVRTEPFLLVTSLTDWRACPARDLAGLYAWRWAIETGYRECKTYLRGAGRALRGRTPDLARQELWALLAVYQAIRILIVRAAARDGIDPDRISFTTTLNAITRNMDRGRDHHPALDALETQILDPRALIPQRPGRVCIRAVRKPSSPHRSRGNITGPLAQHVTRTVTITPRNPHTATTSDQAKQSPRQARNPP